MYYMEPAKPGTHFTVYFSINIFSETSSEELSARAVCLVRRLFKRSEESNMENLVLHLTVYFSAGTKYLSMG